MRIHRLSLLGLCYFVFSVPPLLALTSDDAYQAGSAFYQQGKWDLCVLRCQEAVRLNPDHWQAYQVLGQALFQKGDSAAALDACRVSLGINANNPSLEGFVRGKLNLKGAEGPAQAAYQEGLSLSQQGKREEAIARFREAVLQDPNAWQAYEQLAYAYFAQGNLPASLDSCRVSLWIHPENFSLRTFMDSKAKPQLLESLLGNPSPPPAAPAPTPRPKSKDAIYVDLGSAYPLDLYTYSSSFQFGLGYGLGGLSHNYSLVLESHYASFSTLNYTYAVYSPVYGYPVSYTGGGMHELDLLANSKFDFTDQDNPVVFYGSTALGITYLFSDTLTAYYSPTNSAPIPGKNELDWALALGLGLEIKLFPGVALTLDDSLVFPIVSSNYSSNSYYYGTPDYAQFSMGLKLDN